MRKSVLVTGAGGYIGNLCVKGLANDKRDIERLVAQDIKEVPEANRISGVEYVQGDIRDASIADIIAQYNIDTVVHLASIVAPGHPRDFEYSVDVLGTKNMLEACVKHNVTKFIITSSGAAYGYYADNPDWLVETDEIRGNYEFPYAYHKRLIEETLAEFREKHPELKQLVLRPGTVLGENTNNQITDLFKKPFVIGVRGSDIPFVFIWDQDVVKIILKGVYEDNEGIYNLAGDGAVKMKEIARLINKPYINFPPALLQGLLALLHKLGLSQYGPNQINFLRYRPVLLNTQLKESFGYQPTYTSREVFDLYLRANF